MYPINLSKKIENIQNSLEKLEDRPKAITATIYDLPSEDYTLNKPIDAILKILPDEVMAIIPDLELYGEGTNEIEAINDLKIELIDLYDDLNNIDDNELGKFSQSMEKNN